MKLNRTYILFFIIFVGISLFFNMNRNSDHIVLEQKGDLEFTRREYAKSIRTWVEALRNDPENSRILIKTGKAFLRLAKVVKAEDFFEKALLITPDNYDVHMELVRISILKNDFLADRKSVV